MQSAIKTVKVTAARKPLKEAVAPGVFGFREGSLGDLIVTPGGLQFNDWLIPTGAVARAYWLTPSDYPLPLIAILRVETSAEVFDFSVEPYRLSPKHLPFPVQRAEFTLLGPHARRWVILALLVLMILIVLFDRASP